MSMNTEHNGDYEALVVVLETVLLAVLGIVLFGVEANDGP
jgi:hypothetical protein